MDQPQFTFDALKQMLLAGAGAPEGVGLDGEVFDTAFEEIGYDSLALLEITARIEREYDIAIDETAMLAAHTPHKLVDLVNAQLAVAAT